MNDLKPILPDGIEMPHPLIIAGPCSAETEEQVMNTARELARNGIKIFRAGIWKPRTKPGGFEGIGVEGLEWPQKGKGRNRNVDRYRSGDPSACRSSIECRCRHPVDRSPHIGQPLRNSGDSRLSRRRKNRHTGTYKESRKPRP